MCLALAMHKLGKRRGIALSSYDLTKHNLAKISVTESQQFSKDMQKSGYSHNLISSLVGRYNENKQIVEELAGFK